jgi:hypothetical protein
MDPRIPALPEMCPQQLSLTNGDFPAYGDHLYGGGAADASGIPAGLTLVAPGISAQYMDELILGAEYEVLEDLRLGVSYQNRQLGRVIEDLSTDGGSTYFLGNPGEFTADSEAELMDEINNTTDPEIKGYLEGRLEMFKSLRKFDKPRRDYNAVVVTASKRFSRAFMLQGSYTFSKLEGNFAGLFSPDNGQVDPNITSQYDLIELMANRTGPLPHDRPHSFKLDGYYTFDLEKAGRVTAGARLRAQSGVPQGYLGRHAFYGRREAFILPRGTAGRTDFITSADLHVAYARKIGDMELEVFFQLFNVFNQQTEANVDSEYTLSIVNPIVGGDESDLAYLKARNTGLPVAKNLNYGNTTSRFAPLTGRFGVTLTF